tara:strand:- start:352 stop:1056 length:705 start_codon:yes stop_codon:yes gene_type:complete
MSGKIISCVISCYNEEENLPTLLNQINSNQLEKKIEFVIVNNGSTDNSWNIILENKKLFPEIKFINVKEDLGWGNGIMEGLKHTNCKFVGWIHGDLQYDMKILFQVIEILEKPQNQNQNILIKGKRAKRKFSEDFFTLTMGILASILLRKILFDINAQPSFFSREVLKKFKNTPKDLMLDLYLYNLICKTKERNIIRIPVVQKDREKGQSSWNKNFASKFLLSYRMLIGIIKLI